MRRTDRRRRAGFTLIEMIVAMVLLSIIVGMVAVFIRAPVEGYADTLDRAELVDIGDTTLRRMARDIRLALPNSVRVSGDGRTIEMLVTRTGGRYLSSDDGAPTSIPVLDFLDASATSFTFLGDVPTGKQAILPGDRIVVFNLGPGFGAADAYTGGNSAVVTAVDGGSQLITMASNPFAAQFPPMSSPSSRFHVVIGPVMYQCTPGAGGAGTLKRSSGYAINPVLATPSGGVTALAANRVTDCSFQYVALGTTRSALVVLGLTLQGARGSDGPLTLRHQVNVDNTP